ncbi:hypothetical protein HDU80_010103 [Chytriomyces hyalinus]|nr:hypothetical protein HDU80_010103 [Chytriomyces hyalinus]
MSARTVPPTSARTVSPMPARTVPPSLSAKEKKCIVLKAVQDICLLWDRPASRNHKGEIRLNNAPDSTTNATIKAHFQELFKRIPDHEAAVNLLIAAHKQSPLKLMSNPSLAAKLFKGSISQLDESSTMISYLFDLTEMKVETAPGTFSALDSMVGPVWYHGLTKLRVLWNPCENGTPGSTPLKFEPTEKNGVIPAVSDCNSPDSIEAGGLHSLSREKEVDMPKPASFLWKKATYCYINTANIEGVALQNISNLSLGKVNRDDLMAVLSSIHLGLQSKFSKLADSAVAFIESSLDVDDADADVTQLLKLAYSSAVNLTIGIQTIQFLIKCLVPDWDIPTGPTLPWIGNLCKTLGIETHEASKVKDSSFEDAVHLLMYLSLCPKTDSFLTEGTAIFQSLQGLSIPAKIFAFR